MTYDVAIVGAGPGGSAAALALAQRGITKVCLLDREGFPRDKTCGSGLSPNALKVIGQLGLLDEVRRRGTAINTVRIVTPGGKEMLLSSDAAAVVLLRREFDHLIVQKAVELGVTLQTPFRADSLIKDGTGRITGVKALDGTEVHAKYVLCADGAHSIFATDPRPKRSIATLMGWWEDFEHPAEQLDMIFDKNVAPLYGWMFPETPTRVNIGICVDGQDEYGHKQSRDLRVVFQDFLNTHYAAPLKKARQLGKWKGHPIVFTNWVGHITAPGGLFLGEAARVTHNATGEGIFQSMQSGLFAAEAVSAALKHELSEDKAFSRYVWQHRKRFTTGAIGGWLLRAVVDSPVLDSVATAYNNPTVRKLVVKVLGSALAGSNINQAERLSPTAATLPVEPTAEQRRAAS